MTNPTPRDPRLPHPLQPLGLINKAITEALESFADAEAHPMSDTIPECDPAPVPIPPAPEDTTP